MKKTRDEWRQDVTAQFLRGGVIGIGVFLFGLAFVLAPWFLGKIYPTEAEQTGFRGTGMERVQFEAELARRQEANQPWENFLGDPLPPEEGEPLAGDIYENVQILGHLTDSNFNRLMLAMTEWVAPEEGCAYCHGDGPVDEYGADDLYTKVVTRSMIQMTWAINEDWDAHVADTGVTCYTCHRGNNLPEYIWYEPEPLNSWAGPSAMMQNQARGRGENYWTALPVDALQAYFGENQVIAVHGTTPRNPGFQGASIYDTYRTYAFMMHFSNSLGVNCTYCHNTRALAEVGQATPQWANAQIGIGMVQDINQTYIEPTTEILPDHRLGPLGDAPKANCTTCHQGAPKPLLGVSMLPDWPELANREPVYD